MALSPRQRAAVAVLSLTAWVMLAPCSGGGCSRVDGGAGGEPGDGGTGGAAATVAGDALPGGDATPAPVLSGTCGIPNLRTEWDTSSTPFTFREVTPERCDVELLDEYREVSYVELEHACRLYTAWNGSSYTMMGPYAYAHVAADGVTVLMRRDHDESMEEIGYAAVGPQGDLYITGLHQTVENLVITDAWAWLERWTPEGVPVFPRKTTYTRAVYTPLLMRESDFALLQNGFWADGDPADLNTNYTTTRKWQWFDPDGTPTAPMNELILTGAGGATAIWTGSLIAMIAFSGHDISLARACPDGSAMDAEWIPLRQHRARSEGYISWVSSLWDGEHLALAWREQVHDVDAVGDSTAEFFYFGLFDIQGRPVSQPVRVPGPDYMGGVTLPQLAFDGDLFIVAWEGRDEGEDMAHLYLQRFDRTGNPVGCLAYLYEPPRIDFGIGPLRRIFDEPRIFFDGTQWVGNFCTVSIPYGLTAPTHGSLWRFELGPPPE